MHRRAVATTPVDPVGHHQGVTGRGIRLALALTLLAIAVGPAALARAATSPAKLPDLAMLPPFNFHIEMTDDDRKLLRFSTVSVNVGDGPFRIYGSAADGHADLGETLDVVQWIKREDGSWTERATSAHMSWSGDGHDHWHVIDYQRFKLVKLDDKVVGKVAKTGFCAFDSYPYTSFKPTWFDADRSVCQTNTAGEVLMGHSKGWGDIYRWDIAFQWIDITDVPNGTYKVRVVADPPFASGGRFREKDDSNNRSWTKIRIRGMSVEVLAKSRKP